MTASEVVVASKGLSVSQFEESCWASGKVLSARLRKEVAKVV